MAGARRIKVFEFAPHHGANELAEIAARRRALVNRFAVAQHRDAVADQRKLIHAVGDEDHRRTARLKLADHAKQLLDLFGRERGGRLIHDDEARGANHGARDLDQLLLRRAQTADRRVRVEVEFQPLERAPGLPHLTATVNRPGRAAGRFVAQEDVFGHGQLRRQVQLLMDHRDAQALGVSPRG